MGEKLPKMLEALLQQKDNKSFQWIKKHQKSMLSLLFISSLLIFALLIIIIIFLFKG